MRTSILRNLLLLLLVALPIAADAQLPEVREIENPRKRREHFYHVRSYPFGRIPQGARLNAIYSLPVLMRPSSEKSGGLMSINPWRLIGPSNVGGRVNAIAIHPTDGQTLWAGAASGGVWKSTNRGSSWTPIMDYENAIWVGALAVDPSNPNILYVGTGDPHPSNGDSYPGAGVMKTTDGGTTWRPVGLTNVGAISGLAIDPRNTNIIIAGGTDNNSGIYRSTDAGTTWVRINDQSVSNLVMNPQNPDQLWIGTWADGILRSNDLGLTWQPVNSGIVSPNLTTQRTSVSVCAGTPSVLYVLAHEKIGTTLTAPDAARMYKSTNSGDSWQMVYDSRTTGNDFLGNSVQSQGWYNNVIMVKPDDPNTVIAGGVTMVRTSNGGANWSRVGSNVHADHHAFAADPTNPNVVYNGNDGGIYRSQDGGASYNEISNSLAITQFYALAVDQSAPDMNYGGTQDNGTFAITSTGHQSIAGGDGFWVVVDHSDPNIIYGEYPHGDIWKLDRRTPPARDASNGLTGSGQWSTPIIMDPVDASTLYTGRERVFKTVDGAANWYEVSPSANGQFSSLAISRKNNRIVYAGTNRGSVLVSRDAGENWVDYTFTASGLPNRYIADFAPANANEAVCYVALGGFFSGHVFKSTDYGATWKDISSNLPDVPVNALAVHPDDDDVLFAGSDLGVFVTIDGGATWAPYMNGLPRTEVLDMEIHRERRELRIATYGRSMWAVDLERPTIAQSITAPLGGEVWTYNSTHVLGWAGFDGPVNVELSLDDGQSWSNIARDVVGSVLRWNVTPTQTMWARIRVTQVSDPSKVATSHSFTIEPMKLGGILQQETKPVIAYGLAYDGQHLYTADFAGHKMLKIDPVTLQTVEIIELQYDGRSRDSSLFTDLAFHTPSGNLFIHQLATGGSSFGALYEFTRAGQQVNRYSSSARYPVGLAWMGDDNPDLPYLLASDRDGSQEIYLVDPASGESVITIPRAKQVSAGPRGATSGGGDGKFFQVITDFTGGSLKETTAELMTVEDQNATCTIPLATPNGIMNARGIERDPRDKNVWVTDLSGNIFKVATCEGLVLPPLSTPSTPATSGVMLVQNTPNPFREETSVAFVLPHSAQTKLVVHNAEGRLVATLLDEHRSAGLHRIRFAPTELASGIYRYTLVVDGRESQTRTMVYMR